MRYKIAQEIEELVPGQVLTDGSVWWDEEDRIPITYGAQWDAAALLGFAKDIRRENGELTAELDFDRKRLPKHQEKEMMKFLGATVALYEVEKHVFDNCVFVTRGHLRQVFLTTEVPWAEGMPRPTLPVTA